MTNLIFSNTMKAYLHCADNNIARIISKLINKPYVSNILTDAELNYITFRKDGKISYLPSGKEHKVNEDRTWKRDGRQDGKAAKVIRKIFTERGQKFFKDADFENFANSYKATFSDNDYEFKMLPCSEIGEVYEMERGEGEGSLNNSCMNGDNEYLEMYIQCSILRILILVDKQGKLHGRCLVWALPDGITLMDRFYVAQDFMYNKFLTYCSENKFWRKRDYKSYSNKETFVNSEGETVTKHFTVHTDTDFGSYPYVDTFQYGGEGYLNNYGDGCYSYSNTDGSREGGEGGEDEDTVYDEINDRDIHRDDAVYIEYGEGRYRNRYCRIDDCICVGDSWYYSEDCNIVEIHGDWYEKNDSNVVEIDGEYYLTDDCVYDDLNYEYILDGDSCTIYAGGHEGETTHKNNCTEIDGNWYLDCDVVTVDGEDYYKEDESIVYCEGCRCYVLVENCVTFMGVKYHMESRQLIRKQRKYPRNKKVTKLTIQN